MLSTKINVIPDSKSSSLGRFEEDPGPFLLIFISIFWVVVKNCWHHFISLLMILIQDLVFNHWFINFHFKFLTDQSLLCYYGSICSELLTVVKLYHWKSTDYLYRALNLNQPIFLTLKSFSLSILCYLIIIVTRFRALHLLKQVILRFKCTFVLTHSTQFWV